MVDVDNIRAKIERANEHIGEMDAITSPITNNPWALRRDYDKKTGEIVFSLDGDPPKVPTKLNIICGEAIHQLRSSLDHLVYALVLAQGNHPTNRTQFPIFKRQTEYATRSGPMINGLSLSSTRIIESCQPYHREEAFQTHALWKLREMNAADKHKFLLVASIDPCPQYVGLPNIHRPTVQFFSPSTLEDRTEVVRIKTENPKLHVYIHPHTQIFIQDRFFSDHQTAVAFMKSISKKVSSVVDTLIHEL